MSGGSSSSKTSNTSIVETDNSNVEQSGDNAILIEDINDNATINLTDHGAVKGAFELSGDALDTAFQFGTQALTGSQEFGREVINEAQEISRDALQVAGNAQTNAFSKIREIAGAFTNATGNNTTVILLGLGGIGLMLGFMFFQLRKK